MHGFTWKLFLFVTTYVSFHFKGNLHISSVLTRMNFCFIFTQCSIKWQPSYDKETIHSRQGI